MPYNLIVENYNANHHDTSINSCTQDQYVSTLNGYKQYMMTVLNEYSWCIAICHANESMGLHTRKASKLYVDILQSIGRLLLVP